MPGDGTGEHLALDVPAGRGELRGRVRVVDPGDVVDPFPPPRTVRENWGYQGGWLRLCSVGAAGREVAMDHPFACPRGVVHDVANGWDVMEPWLRRNQQAVEPGSEELHSHLYRPGQLLVNKADVDASTDMSRLDAMPDAASVSTWAREGVAWALGQGAISGVDNNGTRYVDPTRSIYRCEMGAIMKNCTSDNDIIMPPTVTLQEAQEEAAIAPATGDTAAAAGSQAPVSGAPASVAAPEGAADDAAAEGASAPEPAAATPDPKED